MLSLDHLSFDDLPESGFAGSPTAIKILYFSFVKSNKARFTGPEPLTYSTIVIKGLSNSHVKTLVFESYISVLFLIMCELSASRVGMLWKFDHE